MPSLFRPPLALSLSLHIRASFRLPSFTSSPPTTLTASLTTMYQRSTPECRDRGQLGSLDYGDAGYWDRRYKQQAGPFDWYQSYSGIAPLVTKHVPKMSRVLMVGCGNAVMSEAMVEDGYQEITNIDISPVVIEAMQKKYHDMPQLKYITMDARDLSFFGDCTFDSVIDKGTLDSLMCGANAPFSAASMLGEISRVLRPEGVYMLITYGDPPLRLPHLSRKDYDWAITLYVIPQPGSEKGVEGFSKACLNPILVSKDGSYPNHLLLDNRDCHFVYVCTKV